MTGSRPGGSSARSCWWRSPPGGPAATPRYDAPVTGIDMPAYLDLALMEHEARRIVGDMAYAYYAGACDAERLLDENVTAWRRWRLLPHVLVDVSSVSTATTVLGHRLPTPVMVAPTAIQAMAHPDAEVATARGAAAAGAAMVLSSLATRS